jgi:hypothetical protein
MKFVIALSLIALVALSSCSDLHTAKLATGKIVVINDALAAGSLQYGDHVWVDTAGKAPYKVVGYTHTEFGCKTAVRVRVINPSK